jgi:predicted ferric reductase
MNIKKYFAWAALIVISFIPAIIWYIFKPEHTGLTLYGDITHSLGQIAGLIGMTMFALTFVLATRLRFIEDAFDGLDKVYIAHRILGGAALVLLVFHPILLVLKYIPENITLAAKYLLPGTHFSINLGIVAILGLIVLLFFTLYTKIKYHRWKMSHRFLGLIFIFAVLHIFLVRNSIARDNIFSGYYIYSLIISAIGILSFFYSLIINNTNILGATYRIDEIDKQKKGVYGLTLSPLKKPIKFKAGQFVFLRFYNSKISKEAHPFSIACGTNCEKIKVIIKDLGDFTTTLVNLKLRDKVVVFGPYGRFNNHGMRDQIWVAGGIGITPFIAMSDDLKKGMSYNVDLYYSVKDEDEFINLKNFENIQNITKGKFRIIPWISSKEGRLNTGIISKKSKGLKGKDFYLCGPQALKDAIKTGLKESGINEDKIHDEEFTFK